MLNGCTKDLFGVETRSFTGSRRGSNGSFTGFGPDSISNGGNNSQIDVVNEVNAFTSSRLKSIYNQGLPVNQQLGPGVILDGYTGPTGSGYTPYRNFTASNLRNAAYILQVQVHELGHSLDEIVFGTGVNSGFDRQSNNYELAGQKLVDCVRNRGGFK